MRLDHLLSKEHRRPYAADACVGVHAFQWSTGYSADDLDGSRLVRSPLRGAAERGKPRVNEPGTLLGPEEAAASLGATDSNGLAERSPDGG